MCYEKYQNNNNFFLLWLSVQSNSNFENIIAYIGIFSFGLVHGANDIKLLEKNSSCIHLSNRVILFLYILVVIIIASLFYFLPKLALILFIVVSGYHFGEEHWNGLIVEQKKNSFIFYILYGLLVLFLIFCTNYQETSKIINTITGFNPNYNFYFVGVLVLSFGLILCFIIGRVKLDSKASLIEELFYLVIFFIVFKIKTLLLSFALYFVVWHAIPSIESQVVHLYGFSNRSSVVKYLKSSFVYWLFSIISISTCYYYFGDNENLFNALFFSLLAAITFPHVWVINLTLKNSY